MDEHLTTDASGAAMEIPAAPPHIEETSAQYLGRWHRLVSTTNWQKGRIICEWRHALVDADAPASLFSDEAWSQRVGGVSPQHVGRLRRVFERFGAVAAQYQGLYWSHFQAALDWDDAEMWLEGSVQNEWSVARMRQERFNTLGAMADASPLDEPSSSVETDEDAAAAEDSPPELITAGEGEVYDPAAGDDDQMAGGDDAAPFDDPSAGNAAAASTAPFQPFAEMPTLPDDLADAFEAFKVAILHHKLAGWKEIGSGEVVMVLDALKRLALAES